MTTYPDDVKITDAERKRRFDETVRQAGFLVGIATPGYYRFLFSSKARTFNGTVLQVDIEGFVVTLKTDISEHPYVTYRPEWNGWKVSSKGGRTLSEIGHVRVIPTTQIEVALHREVAMLREVTRQLAAIAAELAVRTGTRVTIPPLEEEPFK